MYDRSRVRILPICRQTIGQEIVARKKEGPRPYGQGPLSFRPEFSAFFYGGGIWTFETMFEYGLS